MNQSANRIIDLYERHASAWDRVRKQTRFPEQVWIDQFASLAAPGGAILDLGCGTGEPISRRLSEANLKVTGVDSSASLIELCRTRMPEQTWLVGDMRTIALDTRFDGIIAWHSFFHLPPDDQRAMFSTFAAHSKAGTVLMFTSGPAEGESVGQFQGEDLYHSSLDAPEYRRLLDHSGFQVVAHVADDQQCDGATIWLASR
jgi:2-polyprenyl-3-methyl-5-hydroxy-6-metoxy-1,4-benzoquinol methylase